MIQKNVLLFMSPKSRSGGTSLDSVTMALNERGFHILNDTSDQKTPPNEVILKHSKVNFVIVGGGDGSVNLVLSSLIERKIPLLVIPLGTANNLARSFSLPNKVDDILALLDEPQTKDIDIGLVNDLPFVNVAGLGLSTEINRLTPSSLKRHLGPMAFVLTGLRLTLKMNPFRATITTDQGKVVHSKSWQISVCNGKFYGSGMVIKHDASHDDQILHLLSTEVKKWWKGFALVPSLMTGHYNRSHEITLLSGREIKIETKRKLMVDVDGDIKTHTPARFKVLPNALKLIVPRTTA